MRFYNDASCTIIFGNSHTSIDPANYKNRTYDELSQLTPFNEWKLNNKAPVFAHQIHGVNGFIITNENQIAHYNSFSYHADFLVTSVPGIALGILTADCLPIIIHDVSANIIALVHAGWRGSVAKITQAACESLRTLGSRPATMRVFFGPSANACCYQVGAEVIEAVRQYSWAHSTLIKRNGKFYFDGVLFNKLLLQELGLSESSFVFDYNTCTIENAAYVSYRRDKCIKRQITVAALHKSTVP